ncbi:MAG TPA: hypothetical protein VGI10_17565 [Polyangiaceae bacterium]
MRVSFCIGPSLLVLALLAPRPARADAGNAALAESLFQEGKRLSAAGQFVDACPKFAASYKLDAATGTLLNLAACEESLGQTATAWAHFTDAASLAKREGNQGRADYAAQHIASLETKLIRLIVNVAREANVDGLVVKVDDQSLSSAAFGVPAPIDPGPHTIDASAPGKKNLHFEIKADTPHVTLEAKIKWDDANPATGAPPAPLPGAAPAASPAPAPTAAGPLAPPVLAPPAAPGLPAQPALPTLPAGPSVPSVDQLGSSGRWLGYALGGLGVVGLGAGAFFHFSAVSENDAALKTCVQGDGTQCIDETDQANHDAHVSKAKSNRTLSYVGFGVGGAALLAGVVLVLTAPSDSAVQSAGLVPVLDRDSVGVGYSRAW